MRRHRWKQFLTQGARHSARAVARPRYLTILVVALAVALSITLVPRALSNAVDTPVAGAGAPSPSPAVPPNDGGVTWNPDGTPAQSNNGSGGCEVAMSSTVTGPGAAVIAQLDSALEDEKPDPVGQDGIGSLSLSVPQGTSGTSMTVYADAGVDCSAVNQADAYIRRAGYASPVQFARALLGAQARPAGPGSPRGAAQRAVLLAYNLATWLRVAIGAVVGAVLFAAASVVATALLATLASAAGVTFAPAALALASGCIAGLVAGPVTTAIATGGTVTVTSVLGSYLLGCLAGSAVSAALGLKWIAAVFGQLGWTEASTAVTATVGQAAVADAAGAGIALGPVQAQLAAVAAAAGGAT